MTVATMTMTMTVMKTMYPEECRYGVRWVEIWNYEGDSTPLVQRGCNKKYTHHPVAAAQDIAAIKVFRHASAESITDAVVKYGAKRRSWDWMPKYMRDEINITDSLQSIALAVGLQCFTCDNMIMPPAKVNEWGTFEYDASEWLALHAKSQCRFSFDIIGSGTLPSFCDVCYVAARKYLARNAGEWGTITERALLGILQSRLPQVAKPLKRRRLSNG